MAGAVCRGPVAAAGRDGGVAKELNPGFGRFRGLAVAAGSVRRIVSASGRADYFGARSFGTRLHSGCGVRGADWVPPAGARNRILPNYWAAVVESAAPPVPVPGHPYEFSGLHAP